jgi:hypothetical protein
MEVVNKMVVNFDQFHIIDITSFRLVSFPDLSALTLCPPTGRPAQLIGSRPRDLLLRTIQKRDSSQEVPLLLRMLLVTLAAKLFASSASSPSSEGVTSSEKDTLVLRKPSLRQTRRQPKYPSLTAVSFSLGIWNSYTYLLRTAVSRIHDLEAVKRRLEVRLKS